MAANSDSVHVRMYNVGFGDCFLLTFPGVGGGRGPRVLIDCGSIASASMSMSDVVGTIIGDVTDSDDVPRIDVVICTHRHADHVSGFADSRWKSVQVREVWMPWTEDPKNAEAKRIRESQSRRSASN
jgi:glyoxylase-like metal-dependent hydrolase (beta-lactamase superfamily II)